MRRTDDAWAELRRTGLLGRFILICLGVWLHAADTLVTATILPKVVADIGGVDYMSWNLAIYECGSILSGAAAGMLCGKRGIKQVMLLGSALYGFGCVIAALAGSMEMLLVGRLAQGIGGGLLVTLSYVAIERSFPQHLWTKLFGVVSVLWGVGSLLGPLIGGVLADAGLWRLAFVSFAVQAFLLWIAAARWLPADRPNGRDRASFPFRQILLLLFATASIAEAGIAPGRAPPVLLCALGLLLLYGAARVDRISANPLLPQGLLAIRRPLGAGLFMVFALSAGTTGFATYGPLLLTVILGKSALFSGYILAVEAISWSLATITIANLPVFRGGWLIRLGCLCILGGIGGLSLAIPAGSLPGIIGSAMPQGAGFGLCWPAIVECIIDLADPQERALAAGAASTVQRIGYAVGAAGTGIAAHAAGLSADVTLATARSVGFWIFAGFAPLLLAGLVCCWRFSAQGRASIRSASSKALSP
ncbi:MFS transporter [Acidisoma cellulosilytica]|uniref:MFS transporter n=1 Tax=Acidisoma cellulosilyticum TaxID=2802395 RepID=A0A963Z0D6_9PROT|nr:MFS transporter [Acidisoma cellulosilyticum]MCB8879533.1 MFS transporter [Acidisoma cellulosilyticum]